MGLELEISLESGSTGSGLSRRSLKVFLAANQSATANTSAALNIVLAMKNVQLVALTVIVQFAKEFLS